MKKACLTFSDDYSKKSLDAMVPESQEEMKGVEVKISSDTSRIEIDAQDTITLRAALNSYLRWLNVSKEITDKYE